MIQRGALIVISGFSGAGKGTLVKRIVKDCADVSLSISMTTRKPRDGEVDGKDYFFVTKEQFEAAIEEQSFIEYASYVGNYYGTPKKYVEEQLSAGRDVILEIEAQGALQVKGRFPDAVLVFVTPPSAKMLNDRLVSRGTESPEVVSNRMKRAFEEADFINRYDYLLVNDDLDKCTDELKNLIEAFHHAPHCNEVFIDKLKEDLKAYK